MRCKHYRQTSRYVTKYNRNDNVVTKVIETLGYCAATKNEQTCYCKGNCNDCTFYDNGEIDINHRNKINRTIDRLVDLLNYDETLESDTLVNTLIEFKNKL